MRAWAGLLAAFLALPAWALIPAKVDAVQAPAWVERNGRTEPLAPGMELRSGDRIRTGADARVYLKLAEGSTVKMGENARLGIYSRSQRSSAFRGALDVLTGAFRFTTDALTRLKSREVAIRVGTATVGIRGTDVWGRSTPTEDLVCLIEGKIEISHADVPAPLTMAEPMTVLVAPRGVAPQPVSPIDPVIFRGLARETEILAGDGVARHGGRATLLLGLHATETEALAQYDAVRAAGFAARIKPQRLPDGGWSYRVMLTEFADAAETARAAKRLAAMGVAVKP